MRNAALTLGVIGGIIGMIVGFFGYGLVELFDWAEAGDDLSPFSNPAVVKLVSIVSPVLAIAGGAMARSQARAGGVMMLLSAAGMYWGFGYTVFTMFPMALCGLGGILALAARQPDSA